MTETEIILGIILVASLAAITFLLAQYRSASKQIGGLRVELSSDREKATTEREIATQAREEKARSEAQLTAIERTLADSESRQAELQLNLDSARKEQSKAEEQAALTRQEAKTLQEKMGDWETVKNQSVEAAKAAALSATREMSSKLLEDHKRETDAAKKESEQRVKKVTEDLTKQVQGIVTSVASLNDQVALGRGTLDTVLRALSSPGGAGYFAEIGLENTLKEFGLARNRDFVMRQALEHESGSGRLLPDVVVFLPGDATLVIDSKASKFLLELAKAEGTDQEEEAYQNLSKSMNQHLRALATKDYKSAVIESYRNAGRGDEVRYVINVMYLPNEGALEKLSLVDEEFAMKAAKHEIIVSGPTGLASIIGFARIQIDFGKRSENQERIVELTEALLQSITTVIEHAEKTGSGLRSAAEHFAKMAASINRRMLPRAKGLVDLGVKPTGSKRLATKLPVYRVDRYDDADFIEAEAEGVGDQKAIPDSTSSTQVDDEG